MDGDHAAIRRLPEDLRTALSLREFDGLSYEEIAEIMNCPLGTVRSRIFRAREAVDAEVVDSTGRVRVRLEGYRTIELPGGVDEDALAPIREAMEAS